MTIRARLTWWYAGILLVSFAIMAGVLHYEWAEQQSHLRDRSKEIDSPWEESAEVVFFYGVPTAALLLIGGGWLLRKSLKPISALTEAVELIHAHNLKTHLPRTGNGDELDRLTEVFNSMIVRLDDSFARIQEFTLHASHELKTPLTIMRAELETALRDESCPPAYRELAAGQLDEIQRLTKIVNGLTFLAKADAGQLPLTQDSVRLDEVVRDSFADAQILAGPAGIRVEMPACDEVTVSGDRHRLRQLLLNLTDNAVKYNRPGGKLIVDLHRNNTLAELKIVNSGSGIPAAILPRVFDRFFRGDPSHNNAVEGCGLGLSIAQWIVKAHGGSIEISSEPGSLTTVKVSLPLCVGAPARAL